MREITVAGFVLCGILLAALVVQARISPLRVARLSSLLDLVMADRAARLTVMLFWWWLGWHFLAVPPQP
ncbi:MULTISPECIES: DUF6186 family protein [unclassified Leifsonia]|uniref:DUF6186 family protein n=1 Tax=unclassified Leifsonia TaxID=2663824 RepID=UPI0008A77A92|nr:MULTISPECIES: DUF6186 family protein [unclassified Leifsonia]SEH87413.1 hypothetical protein SAMN04515694_105213 [Leifsonia sp. CL154]SFL49694.1 hypothetical protein SAMN04515692_105213 [Leifsonia sp. CL147]